MFKKFNTTTLLIILVILGGLAALNKFYFSKKSESTFDASFVKIDSSAVTQIFIYPKVDKGKEIKLTRNGKKWDIESDKVKTPADTAQIHRLLASFVDLKSMSLAAEDRNGWGDLQVADTSGSRIKIMTNDNHAYEMVVGKFGFNPASRNGITYIRHVGEEPVYAVEGYLSFMVNHDAASWRVKPAPDATKEGSLPAPQK